MASHRMPTAGLPLARVRSRGLYRTVVDRRVAISALLFSVAIAVQAFVPGVGEVASPRGGSGAAMCLAAILAGLFVRSWAAGTLHKKSALATTGPYALVRNPLYVGSFLMMAGFFPLVLAPWLMVLTAVPIAVIYALAVRDEERLMRIRFPDAWQRYVRSVPRFVPRRIAWPTADGWTLHRWLANAEYNAWIGAALGIAGVALWR
jgi:protein-S-isoprenylcysteine O-methyltransferase Ste14